MRAYADSSFILRLVVGESGTEEVVAEYRRLNRPGLFYLPLHALEVENAIRQRIFHERRIRPVKERVRLGRERDAALSRIARLGQRGALTEVALDMDPVLDAARTLSKAHTDRLGARAIDVLHVACGQALKAEIFLTCDRRQFTLAKATGLQALFIAAP